MLSSTIGEVFLSLCESTDTPMSLGLWLRYKHSKQELAEYQINPGHFTDPASFRAQYLLASFLRKYKGLETGIDTEKVAIQKFQASEERCALTNKILLGKADDPQRSRTSAILHMASRKISAILGEFELRKVLRQCEWTAGATLEIPKRKSFVDTKLSLLPFTVTARALKYAKLELENDGRWAETILGVIPEGKFSLVKDCFAIVDGNRIATVPKDSKTDRVIAVEPRLNIFLQKGVGNYIRVRLKRFGIDLSKQEINQFWAGIAHELDLSTLDLSSASDTIATELVYQLLPVDWALYLDEIRSPRYTLPDGSKHKYEKFSSMGNGFTFELESLVFFAICEAVQDYHRTAVDWRFVSVYGDDLIIPRWAFDATVEVLSICGFDTNKSKSFKDGQFFESCGEHFYAGENVTPAYQKELLDEVEAMRCGNRLMRWMQKHGSPHGKRAWNILRRDYRSLLMCTLPPGAEGDDAWVLPTASGLKVDPNHGVLCRVIRYRKRRFPANPKALLAYSLRKLSWRSNSIYAPKPRIHYEQAGLSLETRIGFLFADFSGGTDEFEVESSTFTFGRRWVHTH